MPNLVLQFVTICLWILCGLKKLGKQKRSTLFCSEFSNIVSSVNHKTEIESESVKNTTYRSHIINKWQNVLHFTICLRWTNYNFFLLEAISLYVCAVVVHQHILLFNYVFALYCHLYFTCRVCHLINSFFVDKINC